jgi:molybdopterin/thiamine biosynthesis adenylyltransferase
MSQQLISHSPDLKRLQDEGYDIKVQAGHLLVKHVPYLNANQEVEYGILVSILDFAGDITTRPSDHVTRFIGNIPCDKNGQPLSKILNQSILERLAEGIETQHIFSSKPKDGYCDYYHKMTTYIHMISKHVKEIDPRATATIFPVIENQDEESVFHYIDTASSRAGIAQITDKLKAGPIAIIGLGGTGSYVLDLVAKTPVREIHLFDGDRFLQHNAFRSPGAAERNALEGAPQKANYFANQYGKMHKHVIPHDYYINESNVEDLKAMSFVFLCADRGEARKLLIDNLEAFDIPFIDVGMGLREQHGGLAGQVRVTTSVPGHRETGRKFIPTAEHGGDENEYSRNIQIADLNALNATLAVIKWKKLLGFYADLDHEHHSFFQLDGNELINDGKQK